MTASEQARRVVEEWERQQRSCAPVLSIRDREPLIEMLTPIFEAATANAMDHTQLTNWRERAEKAEAAVRRLREAIARHFNVDGVEPCNDLYPESCLEKIGEALAATDPASRHGGHAMSEDRHEKEAATIINEWHDAWYGDQMAPPQAARALIERIAAVLRERDAKLEQAEAQRDSLRLELAASEHCRKKDNEYLIGERDALRQQAQIHAQEARTQRATVREAYQACSGATGEPGDWHGAEPIRDVVRQRDALVAAIQRGYCPDPTCMAALHHDEPHSPDCRVAPLLTQKE